MANIIYNSFLKDIATNGIDLTLKDTYKVCLLKESFSDIFNSEDVNSYDNYKTISLAGFECKDTGRYTGYTQGGDYIVLAKSDLSKNDNTSEYYFNDRLSWYNVTLIGNNAPRFILLYREKDGACIACFDLKVVTEINNDDLIIDWANAPVLSIESSDPQGLVDSSFSLTSKNSLQNQAVTQGLVNYGVAIGQEKINLPETETLQVDTINNIDASVITGMFTEEDNG